MRITVRRVDEEDAASIVDLLNPLIRAGGYTIMTSPVRLVDQLAFIRSIPTHGLFLAAIDEPTGAILAIQDILPLSPGTDALRHVGEISTFVRIGEHGKGIGRRLSEASFRQARTKGYRKIRATIRSDNAGALAFYQSLGFEALGTARKHALLGGQYLDEVIAEKHLE